MLSTQENPGFSVAQVAAVTEAVVVQQDLPIVQSRFPISPSVAKSQASLQVPKELAHVTAEALSILTKKALKKSRPIQYN